MKLLRLDGGVDGAGDVVEYGVKKADDDGLAAPLELLHRERLGVGIGFDEQHPDYAVIRDMHLVSPVQVLKKRTGVPHRFALS